MNCNLLIDNQATEPIIYDIIYLPGESRAFNVTDRKSTNKFSHYRLNRANNPAHDWLLRADEKLKIIKNS